MRNDHSEDVASFGIAGLDTFINAFLMMLLMLWLQSLQPKEAAKMTENDETQKGTLCAELYWKDDVDVDIDLWEYRRDGQSASGRPRSRPGGRRRFT